MSKATAVNGQIVTWAIIVGNNGSDTASNVRATDILPKSLISFNATKGSFDSNNSVWIIGDMEYDEVVILIIDTMVNGTGTIINEARVVSDTYDPNMTNNYGFDVIVIEDVPNVEPSI